MIVVGRKGFGEEDWAVIQGLWFTCRMNLGQPNVHQTLLDTECVGSGSPRSRCQDAFRCVRLTGGDACEGCWK